MKTNTTEPTLAKEFAIVEVPHIRTEFRFYVVALHPTTKQQYRLSEDLQTRAGAEKLLAHLQKVNAP